VRWGILVICGADKMSTSLPETEDERRDREFAELRAEQERQALLVRYLAIGLAAVEARGSLPMVENWIRAVSTSLAQPFGIVIPEPPAHHF
jgi:hypothetical protein